ncbi:MAG: DUF5946 family protein [Anaerolineales bacterium]
MNRSSSANPLRSRATRTTARPRHNLTHRRLDCAPPKFAQIAARPSPQRICHPIVILGCWALFSDVLARDYMRLHHHTVDTYTMQHPGQPTPQTI